MAFEAPGKPVRVNGFIEIVFYERDGGKRVERWVKAEVRSTSHKDPGDVRGPTETPDQLRWINNIVDEREADRRELEDLLTEEDWAAVDRIVETIRTEARRNMIPEE